MSEEAISYLMDRISKLEMDVHYLQVAAEQETILVKRRKLHEDCVFPFQKNPSDAGHDLVSIEDVELPFGVPVKIKTGLSLQLPEGYYVSIRDRSGLGSKGIHVLGGVIDCEYTGEYMVILVNLNKKEARTNIRLSNTGLSALDDLKPYQIKKGDKIAQLVFSKLPKVYWSDEDFDETQRGEKGFGASGR